MFLRWVETSDVPDDFVRGEEWQGAPVFVHRLLWPCLRDGVLRIVVSGFGLWRTLAVRPDADLQAHIQALLGDWVVG